MAAPASRLEKKGKRKRKGKAAKLFHTPSSLPHSKHQAKRPRHAPHPFFTGVRRWPRLSSDSCLKKERREGAKKRRFFFLFLFSFLFFLFCSTLSMACTGMAHEGLLPCAICVQRFGNKMILQLIPLIARCCVLQRNRKPSHPSRHVVGAVFNTKKNLFFLASSGKIVLFFFCERGAFVPPRVLFF